MDKLEQEIKQLEVARCAISDLIADKNRQIEDEKPKEWPEQGDLYWSIVSYGNVSRSRWGGCTVDYGRKAIGNIFPTEEAAMKEVAMRKANQHINEWRGYKDEDWVNKNNPHQYRFRIFYDAHRDCFKHAAFSDLRSSVIEGYFKTLDELNLCIKECAPQLRVIFGVEG